MILLKEGALKKSKNILIVIDSIDVNDSSGSKANVALIKNLAQAGFSIKVYHYSQKQIELPNIMCVSISESKASVMYLLSRIQRVFLRITKLNINPTIEKLFGFSFIFFNDVNSIKTALLEEIEFEPDWVLTLSKASSFRPHAALLAMAKWHSKWLAYVHDPYPMHSYPRPYDWVESGHQFKRDFFVDITRKSKYLLYPSQLLADWMQSYYPDQLGKAVIVPHQISNESVDMNLLPDYLNPNEFTVLHAGNMMSARNPTALIEAFERFLKQNPSAKIHSKLFFVGNSSFYDYYIKEKQQTIPQLFLSDGYVPFQTVLTMQRVASVNVILEALGPISPFLPGKFPHCIQTKRPILLLGPFYSESRRLLGEDYPYWSAINDIEKINLHINTLYNRWLESKNGVMDREDLVEYLSVENLQKTITELKL